MSGIGFTGTQDGMTKEQKSTIRTLLKVASHLPASVKPECHHGDCVGADEEFHEIARSLGFRMIGHPPEDDKKRAFCEFDYTWDLRPYLDRNAFIVGESQVLIAAPKTAKEQLRSGTWSTVRKAEAKGIPIILVLPDGTIVER